VNALVFGLGIAGQAVAQAMSARGLRPALADDDLSADHQRFADSLGLRLSRGDSAAILDGVDMLLPAPGVPESHEVILEARRRGIEVLSEIELAYRWEQERPGGPRPMVAITGTDGKTTTTLMAAAILDAAGHRCAAVGNTETPLIAALDGDFDVFAVECSSFRLAFTETFRCVGSAWLNIAPDHLDWHRDMDSYRRAKTKIWSYLRAGDVAVAPVMDASIHAAAMASAGRTVTFGIGRGDYHTSEGVLAGPRGRIVEERAMSRSLPHDVTNALAATAVCVESGLAESEAAGRALRNFRHARHRIEFVAERDGVRWYDDSKATSPHAAGVAIRSFERVVLIAGGRNKGLDLAAMADDRERLRTVVVIGDAADELARVFDGRTPTLHAASMQEAVERAASAARPGDVVLLSPGCTSFDWYSNYGERGDEFQRIVRETVNGKRSIFGRLKKGSR
jgi:UDP-N-acetylmuramoylalanine--D-glutamate ligase